MRQGGAFAKGYFLNCICLLVGGRELAGETKLGTFIQRQMRSLHGAGNDGFALQQRGGFFRSGAYHQRSLIAELQLP